TRARIWPVAPVHMLWPLRRALLEARAGNGDDTIAVVGGGACGCEAAANIAALVAGSGMRVLLITRGKRLWPRAPLAAANRVMRVLATRGVDIVFESTVTGSAGCAIHTRDGRRFAADHIVLASGGHAPQIVHASTLPASDRGLQVGARLHSPADARVFAVGGCGDFTPRPLPPRDGRDLRQASVLAHNLIAGLRNRPYRRYRPRRHPLTFLDLGDGSAVAVRGRLW